MKISKRTHKKIYVYSYLFQALGILNQQESRQVHQYLAMKNDHQ